MCAERKKNERKTNKNNNNNKFTSARLHKSFKQQESGSFYLRWEEVNKNIPKTLTHFVENFHLLDSVP